MSRRIIRNEKQFAEWFKKNYKKLGFSKIVRGDISRFPDFIMIRNGKEVRVELETLASNFLLHKHPLNEVDEIICLRKDAKINKPTIEVKGLPFDVNAKVTLSLSEEIYKQFQKYCNKNAFLLSKKVEIFMRDSMKEVPK